MLDTTSEGPPLTRRLLAVPLVAVALGLFAGSGAAAPAGVPNTVTVLTTLPNAPFEFRRGGRLTGFDVQLVNRIFDAVGIADAQWDPSPFNQIIPGLKANTAQMGAASITVTSARKLDVIFSNPYINADQAIVTRKGSAVNSLDDLAGDTVGALTGSTGAQTAGAVPNAIIVTFPTQVQAYQALLRGQITAVVNDYAQSAWYVKSNAAKFRVGALLRGRGRIAFAFPKSQVALRDAVNNGLAIVKANGTYATLARTWIPPAP